MIPDALRRSRLGSTHQEPNHDGKTVSHVKAEYDSRRGGNLPSHSAGEVLNHDDPYGGPVGKEWSGPSLARTSQLPHGSRVALPPFPELLSKSTSAMQPRKSTTSLEAGERDCGTEGVGARLRGARGHPLAREVLRQPVGWVSTEGHRPSSPRHPTDSRGIPTFTRQIYRRHLSHQRRGNR